MTKKTVLIVDDEPNNIRALKIDLEDTDYEVMTAKDGVEGWEVLEQNKDKITAILLDRMMPNMNGIEFMKKLKSTEGISNIPVIMQTAAAEKEQVAEGIKAGVYYYLTKPYDKKIMLSILYSAINDYGHYSALRKSLQQFKNKLNLIRSSCFEVRTLEDTDYLSTFLAQFFPDPDRVVFGLSELILNALEHGNLGITYDEKTQLNNQGIWREEVVKRQLLPENKNKKVMIDYDKSDDAIMVRIRDEGTGFNWKEYIEISPERATDNHGRGVALSKMISFDEMNYLGCGNEVLCKIMLHPVAG